MKVKSCAASLLLVAMVAAIPTTIALAVDPANFDWYGFAIIPGSVGGPLTLRSVLTNNGVIPTPIPTDFTTTEYTLVANSTLSLNAQPQQYTGGAASMYADSKASGTAANYADPSTFTDGTLILSGVFDGTLLRYNYVTFGNFTGKVNWTGGSRLGELSNTLMWPFWGGWSRRTSGIPSGYQESWDGACDQPAALAVDPSTWGAVKELYR